MASISLQLLVYVSKDKLLPQTALQDHAKLLSKFQLHKEQENK